MSAERNLEKLLAGMSPELLEEQFVFCSFPDAAYGDYQELRPVASFMESEGLTLVIPATIVMDQGLPCESLFKAISLRAHSSLDAIGLTAALTSQLADHGISANVMAGYYHDHVFVPSDQADKAIEALAALSQRHAHADPQNSRTQDNADYRKEIRVASTPEAAYQALTRDFNRWWTQDCDPIVKAGDIATFRFGPTRWTLRARHLLPAEYVELECIDAHHVHPGLPKAIRTEWLGSILRWTIREYTENTSIILVHEGLHTSLDCYEVCEQGWDHFFGYSLRQYLDTGAGVPYESEG